MSDPAATIDLLAMCRVLRGHGWNFLAREAQRPGGLENLRAGRSTERGTEATEALQRLSRSVSQIVAEREWVESMLGDVQSRGVKLTTVLSDDYPLNLRMVYDLPPFLFYRGELRSDDARSVAVVGTRQASEAGLAKAAEVAGALAARGITVLSGLARGIDTAAHRATLGGGGRTIAVIGTGIDRTYPPENEGLADEIAATGAVVSQFWPDGPPRRDSFPRRNAVMSGMSQGTVVIEASATSGAKMQARLARVHGKRVFLVAELVRTAPWARKYVDQGAIEVHSVDDIVRLLQTPAAIEARTEERRQLTLSLA